MAKDILANSPVWEQFQKAAKERRRNPVRLVTDFMRECLEVWEDQKLDEQIRRDVQKSGYREEDAVEIVRQFRREKSQSRAAS